MVRIAEQTVRQAFKDVPDVSIQEIDLVHLGGRALIVASIQSHRLIRPSEIGLIEDAIRRASEEEEVVLVIRNQRPYDLTRSGRIILGEMQLAPYTDKERKLLRTIKESVRQLGNMYVKNMDGIRRDDYWEIYVEILGDRLMRPEEVKELERKVSKEMKRADKDKSFGRGRN